MKKFLLILCSFFFVFSAAMATDLSGTATVNIMSDTVANAKKMAFVEAQRQIISDVLEPYVNVDKLQETLKSANGNELSAMVESSRIDGEKTSDTTYSATITMTIDNVAAKKWLDSKGIQNWLLSGDENADRFTASALLSNGLSDWADLNRIARTKKITLDTKNIVGNRITFELPKSMRSQFTAAVREAGWNSSDENGILQIRR